MRSIILTIAILFTALIISAQNNTRDIPVLKEGNNLVLLKPAKLQVKFNRQQMSGLQPIVNEIPSLQVTTPNCMQSDITMPSYSRWLTPGMDMNLQATYLSDRRDPSLSCTMSMLLPGIGQIYNGQVAKGIAFIAVSYGSLGMAAIASSNGNHTLATVGLATAAVAYVWSFLDAALTSNAMNKHKDLIDLSLNKKCHLTAEPNVSSLRDPKGNYLPGSTNAGLAIAYAFGN
jgi:hypothetical protein